MAEARTAPTVVVPEHVARRCDICLFRSASASTCSMRCTTGTYGGGGGGSLALSRRRSVGGGGEGDGEREGERAEEGAGEVEGEGEERRPCHGDEEREGERRPPPPPCEREVWFGVKCERPRSSCAWLGSPIHKVSAASRLDTQLAGGISRRRSPTRKCDHHRRAGSSAVQTCVVQPRCVAGRGGCPPPSSL